jgi:hypothetical protein
MLTRSKRLLLLATAPMLVAGTLVAAQTAPAPEADASVAESRPIPARFDGHGHGPRGHRGGFGGPDLMRGLFGEVDADADGTVTQAEIDAFRTAQLTAADTSGDGALSVEEFSVVYFERMRPMMVDAFQAFDEDGDGSVTTTEIDARIGDVVSHLDRDGDGNLSLQDRGRRGDRH